MTDSPEKNSSPKENDPTDAAAVRIPPALVGIAGIAVGFVLHVVWPLNVAALGTAGRITIGVAIALLGISTLWLSFTHFRRTGQDPTPWKPTPELFCDGIYRHTRNPIYISLAQIQIGIGVGVGVWWIAITTLPVLVVIHFTAVLPEEAYLERKFGDAYRRYKSMVRRWI